MSYLLISSNIMGILYMDIGDYGRNSNFEIKAIAQLENPPWRKKELEERLRDFERYWQLGLNTIQPHGLNFRNELKEAFFRSRK